MTGDGGILFAITLTFIQSSILITHSICIRAFKKNLAIFLKIYYIRQVVSYNNGVLE